MKDGTQKDNNFERHEPNVGNKVWKAFLKNFSGRRFLPVVSGRSFLRLIISLVAFLLIRCSLSTSPDSCSKKKSGGKR